MLMQHTSLHKSGDSLVGRYGREGPEKGYERFTVHESCVHKRSVRNIVRYEAISTDGNHIKKTQQKMVA